MSHEIRCPCCRERVVLTLRRSQRSSWISVDVAVIGEQISRSPSSSLAHGHAQGYADGLKVFQGRSWSDYKRAADD